MRAFIFTIVCAATATAAADPVVLAIDGKDIYVDLGAKDGVGEGTQLELLHEIVAKDPRTGNVLRDRFALGTLEVAKAGDHVCVAHADEDLAKRVLAGDSVQLASAKRTFVDPWVEQVDASKGTVVTPLPPPVPGAPPVDHAALARTAWQDTLGKPPEKRIERWKQFLAEHPDTPYRKAIDTEIQSLRSQVEQRDAALARARGTKENRGARIAELTAQLHGAEGMLATGPIDHALPGRAIDLAFVARSPSATGFLYVRAEGEPGFRRMPLVRDGDAYLRARIPAELVHGTKLAWYVELAGTGPDAEPETALGSAQQPRTIQVDRVVTEGPIAQGRSHIDAHIDYVDFDGNLGKGFDQYYQAEADFTYRFLEPIHAVRIGFGTLSGTGGPKDVIDLHMECHDMSGVYQCKRVTFTYVYTEFEHRVRPNISVMLRPQVGLLTTDTTDPMANPDGSRCKGSSNITGCEFLTGFGARARVRLGREDATNLVLGVGFTNGVGTLLEAAYNWLPNRVVPVQLSVQVTDQPVPEDFGVRLIADVGWRGLSWFYPSVRLAYQARDIDHAGVSGGAALNFDW
jgi:hypothetical protein